MIIITCISILLIGMAISKSPSQVNSTDIFIIIIIISVAIALQLIVNHSEIKNKLENIEERLKK